MLLRIILEFEELVVKSVNAFTHLSKIVWIGNSKWLGFPWSSTQDTGYQILGFDCITPIQVVYSITCNIFLSIIQVALITVVKSIIEEGDTDLASVLKSSREVWQLLGLSPNYYHC